MVSLVPLGSTTHHMLALPFPVFVNCHMTKEAKNPGQQGVEWLSVRCEFLGSESNLLRLPEGCAPRSLLTR